MKSPNRHDIAAVLLLLPWITLGYPQGPPPTLKVVYLSDLTPVGKPINGYGPYEKDKSNGEDAAGDGQVRGRAALGTGGSAPGEGRAPSAGTAGQSRGLSTVDADAVANERQRRASSAAGRRTPVIAVPHARHEPGPCHADAATIRPPSTAPAPPSRRRRIRSCRKILYGRLRGRCAGRS